ncbi:PQQ-binding-like beta-propeller repeat protein [Verrucomicrobium sp. BvORR034]|uniref:outer membrane protein assembly factor BamB family protein n=1 Tax=Verrucomicrobium sp. BvORR034 TaxID=1396418 RepID=UPI000678CDF5|nr:PQQ-binding-like beta-propeller repeat protein [Verrucomicrobium sp. BvORR034]
MNRSLLLPLITLSAVTFAPMGVRGEEWSRFRGPNGSGVIDATNLPATFEGANTAWKVAVGPGWSSPVLWKDKVILTAETGEGKRAVECLNASDGSVAWKFEVPYHPHKQHKFNAFASSTPFVDAERIYVNWTNGDAVEALALDHQGKLLWRKENLAPYVHEHGSGASAVVAEGVMLVRCESELPEGEGGGTSYLLGLDVATGETKWKLPLPNSKNPYSTPLVRKTAKGSEFIMADTTSGFFGVDAATGKMTWQHNPGFTQRSVGSFAYAKDIIFGTMGSGGGGKESAVLKLGADKPTELYRLVMGIPYVPTPLVIGDLMYLLGDGGILKCVKLETGEEVYNERVIGTQGRSTKYFSSPVAADGKIYCSSQTGDVVVVKAGPQFEILATNKLDGPINATPAIGHGRVYVRTDTSLWALGAKTVPVP